MQSNSSLPPPDQPQELPCTVFPPTLYWRLLPHRMIEQANLRSTFALLFVFSTPPTPPLDLDPVSVPSAPRVDVPPRARTFASRTVASSKLRKKANFFLELLSLSFRAAEKRGVA